MCWLELCMLSLYRETSMQLTGLQSVGQSTGLIICSEIQHDMPVFCRIKKIIVVDSIIYFLVYKLVVDHFNEHFHAYKVFESNDRDVVKADSLVIYKPFDLQSAYGGDESQYIVPLFSL